MARNITIDRNAVGLVQENGRSIGTAFAFVKPHWCVTAKHVAISEGVAREPLSILLGEGAHTNAHVLFAHPELDLAVLKLSKPACKRPLFPAHYAFAATNGLLAAGYAPSKQPPSRGPIVEIVSIPSFEVHVRTRATFEEETIVFPAPESEGGIPGGPIFGPGGGVVGVIIESFRDGERMLVRGTSLLPLVETLASTKPRFGTRKKP